jgi:Transglycosylase SLT domain
VSTRRLEPHVRRRLGGPAAPVLLALGVACVLALLVVVEIRGDSPAVRLVPRGELDADPLAYDPADSATLERAAASGLGHVLYAKSPGGVLVSAARTARFRSLVDDATRGTGIDPDLVEAIVLLESAGRPDVIAGSDPAAAAGLTQILAETASGFLGMNVDLEQSRRLTGQIAAAAERGKSARALRLAAERRAIDARFDPARAIAGTVRYLSSARALFGRNDLSVVSYHMGIGNLETVLRAYAGAPAGTPIRDVVAQDDLSWTRIYFDSSPILHAGAWRLLAGFSDDSQTYYWRVLAAAEIMRLFRNDPGQLQSIAYLQEQKASAEEVLHPLPSTEQFWTPDDLERASREGVLQPLPDDPAQLHFRIDPRLGEHASELSRSPSLYRQLRPEALALLLYLAGRVHQISGASAPLTLTSAVRDDEYQQLVIAHNAEATTAYSLHATGFAFDLLRRYSSNAQARALQYELDQLQARGLIAWVREPAAIHITVASQARELIPALLEAKP